VIESLDPGFFSSEELAQIGFREFGNNVRIARNNVIICPKNISLGNNVRIDSFCSILAMGGELKIGSYVHIAAYCYVNASAGVIIEDFCGLSQGTKVYSRSDDYSGEFMTNPTVPAKYTNVISGKVTFRKHSLIGSSSVVLPGVTVGEGVSVGALSFVARSLEPWFVYFGSPAKKMWPRSQNLLNLEKELRESVEQF
jgi:acetyltransferase-like isoleucine patch superfamily enzyme